MKRNRRRTHLKSIVAIMASLLYLTGCTPGPNLNEEAAGTMSNSADLAGLSPAEGLARLVYLTEEFAPFNYEENGVASGIAVDLLEAVFQRLNVDRSRADIGIVPWAEGYKAVLEEQGTVLFSIARTPPRESLVQWAGPFTTLSTVLYAPTSSDIQISTAEDLSRYRIGAVEASVENGLLLELGVDASQIVNRNTLQELVRMLESGEIDMWATGDLAGRRQFLVSAQDPDAFEIVYPLNDNEFYFSFSKDVPDVLVQSFQTALDEVRTEKDASGVSAYERIVYRHLVVECSPKSTPATSVTAIVDRTAEAIAGDAEATLRGINAGEAAFRDPTGPDLFVVVYDGDLTVVAHASDPGVVGARFAGMTDVEGTPHYDQMLQGAREKDSGWTEFVFVHPTRPKLYRRSAYYREVLGSDGATYIVRSETYKECP